jgi:hypothetical protein
LFYLFKPVNFRQTIVTSVPLFWWLCCGNGVVLAHAWRWSGADILVAVLWLYGCGLVPVFWWL